MRKYVAEFTGTFVLVFCGTGAIIIDQQTNGSVTHVGIAMTFGLTVMTMIYALGNISGAHFNPAVTIGFYIASRFSSKEILPYLFAQLFGALSASGTLKLLFPENQFLGATMPSGSTGQCFVIEYILSFILMFVIIHVAHGSKEQGMFAGLAIGSVVLLEAMFAGPVTGASMNPARSIAPAIVSGNLTNLWIYIFAPISGSISSVGLWNYLKQELH
jgi:aquaporin Z